MKEVQIDVKEVKNGFAICYLYTGDRCVQIVMPEHEYANLVRDEFFIRDGKKKDSAGIVNTTDAYIKKG